MIFTKEQWAEISPFHVDDFPIDSSDQDEMLRLFNIFPTLIQGKALCWGLDDTVVREDVFKYVCEMALDQTVEEYYESENFKNYTEHKQKIPMDMLIQIIKNNQKITS
jgi:hypothetical protein